MQNKTTNIVKKSIDDGCKGGLTLGLYSCLSGSAITTTCTKFSFLAFGAAATSTISWPVFLAYAGAGFGIGALRGAFKGYRQAKIRETEFDSYLNASDNREEILKKMPTYLAKAEGHYREPEPSVPPKQGISNLPPIQYRKIDK